jgi:FixJ family two-component response regulator
MAWKKLLAEAIASSSSMPTTKIVIVDDDHAVREAMKFLMRSYGYHASTFGSADEFLESAKVHDTSCLITDVQMPGLSGIELQDWLIARGYRTPIIFITAYSDENVRIRAMKAGAVAFLIKPIDCHQLVDHVEKALKAAWHQDARRSQRAPDAADEWVRRNWWAQDLEEPLWTALKQIAHAQHVTLSALVAQIDDTREQSNLSSAIRVFVLRHSRLAQRPSGPLARTRARGERNQL